MLSENKTSCVPVLRVANDANWGDLTRGDVERFSRMVLGVVAAAWQEQPLTEPIYLEPSPQPGARIHQWRTVYAERLIVVERPRSGRYAAPSLVQHFAHELGHALANTREDPDPDVKWRHEVAATLCSLYAMRSLASTMTEDAGSILSEYVDRVLREHRSDDGKHWQSGRQGQADERRSVDRHDAHPLHHGERRPEVRE
jgi:hypothetical protein